MASREENDTSTVSRSQPPQVLGAWVQEQLAQMERVPVRNLAGLQGPLRAAAYEWDAGALEQALTALATVAAELRFDELRVGWFARGFGRHKPVYARFAAAHERIVSAARELRAQQSRLLALHKDLAPASRRLLVELAGGAEALESGVEQGVTWLQHMWTQITQRREEGGADTALADLAEAAQAFTHEFKRMQGIAGIAGDLGVRMHGLLDRRAALCDLCRRDLEKIDGPWSRALDIALGEMKAGRVSDGAITSALEEHMQLLRRLDVTLDSCSALQQEQHVVAQHLELLRRELEVLR